MKGVLLLIIATLLASASFSQSPPLGSFGGFYDATPEIRDEISPEERALMFSTIKANIVSLARKGITASNQIKRGTAEISFGFPLKQAPGFNDKGFYGISNYVDVNSGTGIRDYNCGSRTYNGHMGTDFFTVPFWWKKMDENAVEIVAAEDGIIVARGDVRSDTSCAMCPAVNPPPDCNKWNAVYLQHADGTLSIYGHMKKNSLTSKQIGDAVSKGEFLGIVGSSGNSTGPHLHFEVWKDTFFTKLINPWGGSCNPDGNASMWDEQEPYYNAKIIKVMTGSALPEMKECYDGAPEKTFAKTNFVMGQETVFVTNFVRDNRPGGPVYKLWVFNPDGSTKYNWTLNPFNGIYGFAWFYYTFPTSEFTVPGDYTFRLVYGTDTADVAFNISTPAPLDLTIFNARSNKDRIQLQWSTENEVNTDYFEIKRSSDGNNFITVGKVAATGDGKPGTSHYSFEDDNPNAGINYYRLKMTDKDGEYKYSTTEKVNYEGFTQVKIFPNPAENSISLQNIARFNRVRISDMNGRILLQKAINGNECILDISTFHQGIYVVHLSDGIKDIQMRLIKNK